MATWGTKVQIAIKEGSTDATTEEVEKLLQAAGCVVSRMEILGRRVIVAVGDALDLDSIKAHPAVQEVINSR